MFFQTLALSLFLSSVESDLLYLSGIRSHQSEEAGLNEIAEFLRNRLAPRGFEVSWDYPTRSFTAERRGASSRFTALLVGHIDTAYGPSVQLAQPEFIPRDPDKPRTTPAIRGPGTLDAKVGVLQLLSVLERLEHSAISEAVHWKIFLQADEEIFSQYSRKSLIRFSNGADLCLVFEFAWYEPDNDQYMIPVQVGGNMSVTFNIERQTNHSGVSVELGRNANDIAAEVIADFASLRKSGISVRISNMHSQDLLGGKSTLTVRLRYSSINERAKIRRRLLRLKQRYSAEARIFDYKISDIWQPHQLHIPEDLLLTHRETAVELGFKTPIEKLTRTHDAASFISRRGVPVLTSIGLPGQGSHSADEIVYLGNFSRRTDLACGVILKMLAKT